MTSFGMLMARKKVVHVVSKYAMGGGIGTVVNYLQEGLNSTPDFKSDLLTTSYEQRVKGVSSEGLPYYEKRVKELNLQTSEGSANMGESDLEKSLSSYDVVHVHGIPDESILRTLKNIKGKSKSPKIVNTAHSSVKQEFLTQYASVMQDWNDSEKRKQNPQEEGKLIYEYRAMKHFMDSRMLENPAPFNETYWGSAIDRQEQIMSLADSVQHMNEVYKQTIIEEYHAHENKGKHIVIPNGVKKIEGDISSRPHKKRILFVGRFAKEKGIDELIDSLPYLLEMHPDASFRIVGGDPEGKLVEDYKEKARQKISNHFKVTGKALEDILVKVEFPGWISDKQALKQHYLWSDYVIVPSSAESFSLTASEALMYKRIPILTATPALKDLYIDKGIAFGINPDKRTGKGIAETLSEILKDDSSGKNDMVVEKGHKFVNENYSFEKMIASQVGSYKKLLKN